MTRAGRWSKADAGVESGLDVPIFFFLNFSC